MLLLHSNVFRRSSSSLIFRLRLPSTNRTQRLSTAGMKHPPRPEAACRFIDFVDASPTPFHVVHNASKILEEKGGFTKVYEADDWESSLEPGGKYYFTRNQSSLVAFSVPADWKPGHGVSIVATHVDSPNLRVRPVSKKTKAGYLQVGVETYGGGLWHTWFDRDLSLAGRVVVADKNGGAISKLIKIDRPILRVPSLAIHLERGSADNFQFNQETNMVPILGLVEDQLNSKKEEKVEKDSNSDASSVVQNHHPALLSLLSDELSIAPEDIRDFELQLYDTQPAALGGLNNEFVFAPRMDNQLSSFCAVEAISSFATAQAFPTLKGNVNVIALFNHEEIGSVSTSGAESSLIPSLLARLSPGAGPLAQSVARSLLVSCDVGHAIHPNYTSKHEENHAPKINGGVVIKTNAKQRYASDAIGTYVVKKLITKHGGNVQEFEVRNDMACGSTVGPMLSKLGVRTVDIGNAILSMHSIRETGGSYDVQHSIDLFKAFFEGFAEIDKQLQVD